MNTKNNSKVNRGNTNPLDNIISSLLMMRKDYSSLNINYYLSELIIAIDCILECQVNEILHTMIFQKLEASWRNIKYLVDNQDIESKEKSKVKLLHCTWAELEKDALRSIEYDHMAIYSLIYKNEYGMAGGEPFGLIIGDYEIAHCALTNQMDRELSVIAKLSEVASAAFSPVILSGSASLFGVDDFYQLASTPDLSRQFQQAEYGKWQRLRLSEESRFIGITMPHTLMREPYKNDGSRLDGFDFNESIKEQTKDLLWGSSSYCFAAVVLRAYQESGWFTHIRGYQQESYSQGVILPPLVSTTRLPGGNKRYRSVLDLIVSERKEQEIAECGFISLSPIQESPFVAFSSNTSLYKGGEFEGKAATMNAKLSSMLQYTLCVSRIAHYVKLMARDKIGSYQDADAIQRDFQKWLHQYTTASDEASDELRAKYPLNEARIEVNEKPGRFGEFYSVIHLRPHFQLDQMVSSIKLITELTPQHVI